MAQAQMLDTVIPELSGPPGGSEAELILDITGHVSGAEDVYNSGRVATFILSASAPGVPTSAALVDLFLADGVLSAVPSAPGTASVEIHSLAYNGLTHITLRSRFNFPGAIQPVAFAASMILAARGEQSVPGIPFIPSYLDLDFTNTANLRVSLPSGYAYTSESGVLLSAVPVPGAAWLFASGLSLLAALRARSFPSRGSCAPVTGGLHPGKP